MAKARARDDLYERDFFVWTQEQAAVLRRDAARRVNTDLDLENLAEEIESLGKRDRRALLSDLSRIVEHLLKLQFGRVEQPGADWQRSVDVHRVKVARILEDSPSLKSDAGEALLETFENGRGWAERSLARDPEVPALPERCPYTLDQVLDRSWWPQSPTG